MDGTAAGDAGSTPALSRLVEVARGLSGILDLDRLLSVILDGVIGLAGAERGAVLLRGADDQLAAKAARNRKGEDLDPARLSISRSVLAEVEETGQAILVDDAAVLDTYRKRESVAALNLRTILCVPLRGPSGSLGTLYVDSHLTAHRFTDDDRELTEAFAAIASVALETVRLHEASRERDRMAVELDLAARIQRSFLPVLFPDAPGWRGTARAIPAGQVGGDFYDFVELPGGRTAVLVADVSGKGVPAALDMARLVSQIRSRLAREPEIAALLRSLNRTLLETADGRSFVTVVAAVLDPLDGGVEMYRCGHPPPLFVDGEGVRVLEMPGAPPLGLTETFEPRPFRFQAATGSVLVLYTDGALDGQDPRGRPFGGDRLADAVRRGGLDAEAISDSVLEAIDAFSAGGRRADDLTLVAVERALP